MESAPESDAAMPQTRYADPETQRTYALYVAHVVAWLRYEAALDTHRLYRADRARGPQLGILPDLQRLTDARQALDAALDRLVASAREYAGSVSGESQTCPPVDPLDLLDDVLDVSGAVSCELVMAWLRTVTPRSDVHALLTGALASGRYALHRHMVRRGSHPPR